MQTQTNTQLPDTLSNIQGIFDNKFDKDVIAMVLEANNGQVEKTIEVLLRMSGEHIPEDTLDANIHSQESQISQDEALAKALQEQVNDSQTQKEPSIFSLFLRNSASKNPTPQSSQNGTSTSGISLHPPNLQMIQTELNDFMKSVSNLGASTKTKILGMVQKLKKNDNSKDDEVVAYESETKGVFVIQDEEEIPLEKNTKQQQSIILEETSPKGLKYIIEGSKDE